MPQVSLVCPHCETPVHLQVTEVARSRPCPACGESLMLQVAERTTGTKRKALLVGAPLDSEQKAESLQKQFIGQPFDRMRADPELARAKKRFFYGVTTVAALILAASLWSLFGAVGKGTAPEATPTAETAEVAPQETRHHIASVPVVKKQAVAPMLSRPMDFEQIIKKRVAEAEAETGMRDNGGE